MSEAACSLAGIICLDLKGYSKLDPAGQNNVFKHFLPKARELLDSVCQGQQDQLLDANTWGDSIVAVFRSVASGAKFALGLRDVIRNEVLAQHGLEDIQVRIALHAHTISYGTDQVRDLAKAASHVYGTGMVIPARLEPQTPGDQVFVTGQAAEILKQDIKEGRAFGNLVSVGTIRLAKNYGTCEAYWLGQPREEPPKFKAALATSEAALHAESQVRLRSIQFINDYVEKFHRHAQGTSTLERLESAFRRYHLAMLRCLSLPAPAESGGGRLNADVLLIEQKARSAREYPLVMTDGLDPTNPDHKNWVPIMAVAIDPNSRRVKQPKEGDGLAPYVLWANTNDRLGVGVAPDVMTSSNIVYYEHPLVRAKDAAGGGAEGSYRSSIVERMYKRAPREDKDKPPYCSILSAALMGVDSAKEDPAADVRYSCIGVLNITSPNRCEFTHADCVWAETAASLFASVHQSYRVRRGELAAGVQGTKKKVGRRKRGSR